MKKIETKLHLLENEIMSEVITNSDMYDDDSYFDNDDFRNIYKDFNFVRKMSFMYEYITENDECIDEFDYINNDDIEIFITKLQNYNIDESFMNECIKELRYIIDKRK